MSVFKIYPDSSVLAQTAVQAICDSAACAISERGVFHFVLSGGSTPKAVYSLLAQDLYRSNIDWSNVHLWWGDERSVPPNHPDSNYLMVRDSLIQYVNIPAEHIHRIQAELNPAQAAQLYESELEKVFQSETLPCFDLILLGLGEDGHTASLFPGTSALYEHQRWVIENYIEKLDVWRITLTLPLLNCAKQMMVLVNGKNKAQIVKHVLQGDPSLATYPIQLIQPVQGQLIWLLDSDAANQIQLERQSALPDQTYS